MDSIECSEIIGGSLRRVTKQRHGKVPFADPGEQFSATLTPRPNVCGASLKGGSLIKMLTDIEAKIKNYSKPNNALHFIELHDLRAGFLPSPSPYYQIVSTLLFLLNNTTVSVFLSIMRTV